MSKSPSAPVEAGKDAPESAGVPAVLDDGLMLVDMIELETTAISSLSVQDELWRIFTFYTLQSDSNNLELLKVSQFVKFAKDAQISSKKFTSTQIELELAKILRILRRGEIKVGGTFLTFVEFLASLEAIACRLYANVSKDVAVRRLLLENVLLLAGRRTESLTLDLKNTEANTFISGSISKGLMDIFKYYITVAEMHRSVTTSNRTVAATGTTGTDIAQTMTAKEKIGLRKELRTQITFREFVQFCLDFQIKSNSLLTGMQAGHVFLTAVPLDDETKTVKGMTFDLFCSTLIHIALLSFRQFNSPKIKPLHKVKALFLQMWKTVNKPESAAKAVKGVGKGQREGGAQLNIYGSTLFSDHFLKIWQSEGFCDYVILNDRAALDKGGAVVDRIAESGMGTLDDEDPDSIFTPEKGVGAKAAAADAGAGAGALGGLGSGAKALEKLSLVDLFNKESGAGGDLGGSGGGDSQSKPPQSVRIKGSELEQLLKKQPELAELILLELKQLKM